MAFTELMENLSEGHFAGSGLSKREVVQKPVVFFLFTNLFGRDY